MIGVNVWWVYLAPQNTPRAMQLYRHLAIKLYCCCCCCCRLGNVCGRCTSWCYYPLSLQSHRSVPNALHTKPWLCIPFRRTHWSDYQRSGRATTRLWNGPVGSVIRDRSACWLHASVNHIMQAWGEAVRRKTSWTYILYRSMADIVWRREPVWPSGKALGW